MITPAIITPTRAESRDFQNFISNNAATRVPVQAPVAGRGMATKSARPQKAYFSILSRFFSAFSKSLAAILFMSISHQSGVGTLPRALATGQVVVTSQGLSLRHSG